MGLPQGGNVKCTASCRAHLGGKIVGRNAEDCVQTTAWGSLPCFVPEVVACVCYEVCSGHEARVDRVFRSE